MPSFFSNEHGLRQPRFKNYALHALHRLGLLRFREKRVDLGNGLCIQVREGTHDELIVREIWQDRIYPLGEIEFSEGDVVIDIGAQIGSFSLLAASLGARVVAFEPCPMNLRMLHANIALNGFQDRIEVHGVAVSRPDVHELRLYQSYTNLGGHSSYCWVGPSVTVPCTSLTEILQRDLRGPARVLKIDAEGAESAILFGTSPAYLQAIDLIFAEVIDHPAINATALPGEPDHGHRGLTKFLRGLDFHVERDPKTKVAIGRRRP